MIIAALALFLSLSAPAVAQETPAPVPASAPAAIPARETDDGDFSAFDFFVGGVNYGAVYGHFGNDWFEPENAADMLELMPPVKSRAAFSPLFANRIEKTRNIPGVGIVTIDTANFRIALDVDREQAIVAAVAGEKELVGSEKHISVRNNIFAAGSSTTEDFRLSQSVSVGHDTVISKRDFAFQNSGTYAADGRYALRNALVRKNFKSSGEDMTASAGLLETSSNMRFARSMNYFGVRLATNEDLLFRDKQLQGSGLEVFLSRRAQVTVYRDSEASGQILFSRLLDFGTIQIDTRGFPAGAYNVEIVAREGGAVVLRETRPFVKTQRLPPAGKTLFSFDFGEMRDELDGNGIPVAFTSYRRRLTDSIGGGLGIAATSDDQVVEASLYGQSQMTVFKSIGILETSLTGAFAHALKPAGLEASVLFTSKDLSMSLIGSKSFRRADGMTATGGLALSDRQSLNAIVAAPFSIYGQNVLLGLTSEISRTDAEGEQYRYGPTLAWRGKEGQPGDYVPEVKMEYSHSDDDDRFMATLTVRSLNGPWSKTAESAFSAVGSENRVTAQAGLRYNGPESGQQDWRKNVRAGVDVRADPAWSNDSGDEMAGAVGSNIDYTARFARVAGYIDQNLKDSTGIAGGELYSATTWTRESGFAASAENVPADMTIALIHLAGDKSESDIDITVNGSTRATARVGDTVTLAIPSYEEARIGAYESTGKGSVTTLEQEQSVVGFPGNVAHRTFTLARSIVLSGRLLDSAGAPLASARFKIGHSVFYADDDGSFVIERAGVAGGALTMEGEEFSCPATITKTDDEAVFVDLGDISCTKKP